jgi:lipopolysaccharide transport system permease protein
MTGEAEREFVNRPNRFNSLGASAWRQAFRELLGSRDAIWQLVWRDVASRYRQSFLGLGWAILTPLALVLVFLYLRENDVVDGGPTAVPYPLFLYAGLLPWQLFQASVTRMTVCLAANPALVTRVRFPREILVLSSIGGALFDFLLGTLVLGGFFVWYGVVPQWTCVWLPLLLVAQLLFALALGLVLSVLNAAMRDIASMVPLVLLLWMFLTPVLYPRGAPWMDWLNPMAPFIASFRDLAFHGGIGSPGPLILAVAVTLMLLPIAWRLFHMMLPRVAETV